MGNNENVKIAQDENLDINSLFRSAAPKKDDIDPSTIVAGKSPLDSLKEKQGKGMVITNVPEEVPKLYGPMNEERLEGVKQHLEETDAMIEKAQAVSIVRKPKNETEMVELMDALDNLDIDELHKINEMNKAMREGRDVGIIKENDLEGADINANTSVLETGRDTIGSDLFVPRGDSEPVKTEPVNDNTDIPTQKVESDKVSVVIKKEAEVEGNVNVINFTEEEHEKLSKSTQIDLVNVRTVNINTGRVKRPVDTFMDDYKTNVHKSIAGAVPMTFVGSRFYAQVRGLTFGEYIDVALSSEIGDVDKLNKRLSILYDCMVNTSIGHFESYDDFLKNFAYVDLPLGVYAMYIATNPEILSISLTCGVDECKKNFDVSYSPRNLLRIDTLEDRYKEIMEKTANMSGKNAMDWHMESTLMTRTVIELPGSKIALEMGLRSCYENIHYILPFVKELQDTYEEKYPNDTNKIHQILAYLTKYISAIYFQDENGDYTIREDNISNMLEVLYTVPIVDYSVMEAMVSQAERDYNIEFGITDVECPNCHTKTKAVAIDLDAEVFQKFQEQGTTHVNMNTLPRL